MVFIPALSRWWLWEFVVLEYHFICIVFYYWLVNVTTSLFHTRSKASKYILHKHLHNVMPYLFSMLDCGIIFDTHAGKR